MATIGFVSLGCDKNRINCEQMLYRLMEAGHEILDTPELAEVVIVNTCAFIESARSEAIENILEIAQAKPRIMTRKASSRAVKSPGAPRISTERS